MGGRARAAVVAPGLDLGLGLAAGCGRGVLTGLGGLMAAVLGFGWIGAVGLVGAWALAAAGLLAVGVFEVPFGRCPPRPGGWSAG